MSLWVSGTTMDDRQMIVKSEDESAAPEGKRWVCCTACQGAGKILVDDVGMVSRPGSVSNGSDGVRSPNEERRRGNNPFGPKGTLRCLPCQRRKKKCEFETLDSICLRCMARGLACGPKLGPQQRPRSVTSVPSQFARPRPVSLNIDTTMLSNPIIDDEHLMSAGSIQSAMRSVPASPFIHAYNAQFDPRTATPLNGSPHVGLLDNLDTSAPGINFNFTAEERQQLQALYNTYNAPPMSHQNSQQTIKHMQAQSALLSTTPTVNLVPAFDPPPVVEEAKPIPIKLVNPLSNVADIQHLFPADYVSHLPSQNNSTDFTSPTQPPLPSSAPQAWDVFSIPDNLATSAPFEPHTSSLSQVAGKVSQPPPHCEKCGTVVAKVWRKNLAGSLYCERCGTDQHLINLPTIKKREMKAPGPMYWRAKFNRMEAPSFNSVMSDENDAGSSQQISQDSEEMLFDMDMQP